MPRRNSFHSVSILKPEEDLPTRADEKLPPKSCLQALHILKAVQDLQKTYPIITFVGTASLFFTFSKHVWRSYRRILFSQEEPVLRKKKIFVNLHPLVHSWVQTPIPTILNCRYLINVHREDFRDVPSTFESFLETLGNLRELRGARIVDSPGQDMRLWPGLLRLKQERVTLDQLGYSEDQITETEKSFSQHLRKPLEGLTFGEKTSLALTLGTISPGEAYDMVELRTKQNLLDHLEFLALRDYCQIRIYRSQGQLWNTNDWEAWDAHGYMHAKVGKQDFRSWTRGTTPDQRVNLTIRRLEATGYASHKDRLLLVRYFIEHVRRPWQGGADYFSTLFADYDYSIDYYFWVKEACRYDD